MLVIGGRDPSIINTPSQLPWWSNGVDPWPKGMSIFDMNTLKWTGSYSPSATYDRPAMIQQYYADKFVGIYIPLTAVPVYTS